MEVAPGSDLIRSAWLKLSELVNEAYVLLNSIEQKNDFLSKIVADNLKTALDDLNAAACILKALSEYVAVKGGVTKASYRYLHSIKEEVKGYCSTLERIDAVANTALAQKCSEVAKLLDTVLK
jgi:hypothetical protein